MRRLIGVVAELNRFPVKSMAGEELAEADVRWSGLRGDREYGFVKTDRLSRFPWFTGRDHSPMLRYRAVSTGDYGPAGLPVEVTTPDGRRLGIGDPALADEIAAAAGGPVQLMQLSRGTYDSMPVSLVTRATLAAIDATHGAPLDPRRFRINIVIDSAERDIEWRGGTIEFGLDGARLAVVRPIERCAMITIDPDSAARDAGVMRTVAQRFGNQVGEYASVLRQGPIRVGDEVYLLDAATTPAAAVAEPA